MSEQTEETKGAETSDEYPAEPPVELGVGTDQSATWRSAPFERPKLWAYVLGLRQAAETAKAVNALFEAEREEEWKARVGESFPQIDPSVQPERARHAREAGELFVRIRRAHAAQMQESYLSLETSAAEHVRFYRKLANEGPKGPSPTEVAVKEARAEFEACIRQSKPFRQVELKLMEAVIQNLGGETQLEHAISRAMVLRAEIAAGLT